MTTPRQEEKKSQETRQKSYGKCFKLTAVMFLLMGVVIATLPIFNFRRIVNAEYFKMTPGPSLEGNLKPNDKLTKASFIGHKQVIGPETIAISSNGSLFSGLMNGQIVRIDQDGIVHIVTRTGSNPDDKQCSEISKDSFEECGHPLGLRIKPQTDLLYFVDAFHGVFKIDLLTGVKHLVLSSKDSRFGEATPKLLNDLDLDGDDIYFIDSSHKHSVVTGADEIIEMRARGRLFKYNEKTDKLELLLENLYMPNGLQLLPSKDAVLINECTIARVLKVHIKGTKMGQSEVWADLPGFGDSLRVTERNTVLMPISSSRSLGDNLAEYPIVRSILGTVFDLKQFHSVLPKYGLLVEYDLNGQVLRSWHDPTGQKIESISNAVVHANKIYLGSFYNDFIGVVDYD